MDSQEAQASFASRETDAAMDALDAFRKGNDALGLQQSHWDDLRCTNEPELKELRHVRDRSKVLECEYTALQRSYKEQETRAAEWEQLASENAAALEEAQVVRDQAEDRAAKLEAEKVLLRMQLDETERLAKVRVTPCRVAENVTEGRGVVFVVLGPREHAE